MHKKRLLYSLVAVAVGIYLMQRFKPDLEQLPVQEKNDLNGAGVLMPEYYVDTSLPRGIRNNNPLNIRHNAANDWLGMVGQDSGGFVIFDKIENGYRAASKILDSYAKRGITSVNSIVEAWAPAVENDTDEYIAFLSYNASLQDNAEIDSNLQKAILLMTMETFENGHDYDQLSFNEILQAVS